MTRWKILNKYPFTLRPGQGRAMESGGVSYYDYLNKRPTETGKNVQCIATLIKDLPTGLHVWEPFGGVGVFAVAIQEILKPGKHTIHEIDDACLDQLTAELDRYGVKPEKRDALEALGSEDADVFICDFPLFSMGRYLREQRWEAELKRMTDRLPLAIIMTDGSSCRYHLQWKNYRNLANDDTIGPDRRSYCDALSRMLHDRYGYSIVQTAWHGNSFYHRLENREPGHITMTRFPAGTASDGLRRLEQCVVTWKNGRFIRA